MYMQNIKNFKKKFKYSPMFQLFYSLVYVIILWKLCILIKLLLIAVMGKYQITVENMYYFDAKDFMIGIGQAIKHIMIREKL